MTMSIVTESASARSSPPSRDVLPGAEPHAERRPAAQYRERADSTVSAAVQRRQPATRLAIAAATGGARMGASSSTVISRAAPVAGRGRRRRRRGASGR